MLIWINEVCYPYTPEADGRHYDLTAEPRIMRVLLNTDCILKVVGKEAAIAAEGLPSLEGVNIPMSEGKAHGAMIFLREPDLVNGVAFVLTVETAEEIYALAGRFWHIRGDT